MQRRRKHLSVLPSSRSVRLSNSESKSSASSSILSDSSSIDGIVTINRASQPILTTELDMLGLLINAEASARSIRTGVGRVRCSEAQASINSDENLLAAGDDGVKAECVVAAEELGGCGVRTGEALNIGAVDGGVLEEEEFGFSGVHRGVLDLGAGVDGKTAKGTGGGGALVEGVLAEAASVQGSAVRHVGVGSDAALVVGFLTGTLASSVIGRALSLVGRESSDGVRSAALVVLGDTARGVRASGDGLELQASVLAERVLAETASVVGSTLGHVGRETVRTTSGSACVVLIVASTLASGVVGRALSLVGGKTISTASSAAGIGLSNAASCHGLGGSGSTAGNDGSRSSKGGESQGQGGNDD